MIEFKIPEVGENIESGSVVSIAVAVGDVVSKDQDLLELETDKATIPVPSSVDGTIKEILISEGDEVKIGQVVMKIDGEARQPSEEVGEVSSDSSDESDGHQEQPVQPTAPVPTPAPKSQPQPAAVAKKSNEAIPAQTDVPAAPSVRRLARELGIEVSLVPGTGPGGRISKEDVKAYAKFLITSPQAAGPVSKPLPDFSKFGSVKTEPMNKIRTVTAEHLSYCWQTIPHVTQFGKADITKLNDIRKEHSTEEAPLTITPFIMKIMALALKEFPQFNASVDLENKQIVYKEFCHIGCAVDTDRGLLVPKIRDCDKKSVLEISAEIIEAAERARDKKTSLDELQGGSMTLTNLGGIYGTSFTPIVNWPEVAILGLSRGGYEPVWEEDKFAPRLFLPLSLSYDHRIIDGADGARFLKWVANAIETYFNDGIEGK